jgi:hypothetical protein
MRRKRRSAATPATATEIASGLLPTATAPTVATIA